MLRVLCLFILLFFLCPVFISPAFPQAFISGTILETNPEKMELVIGIKERHGSESYQKQRILIRSSKENIFPLNEGKSVFPNCVIEGDQIRIWGEWESDSRQVFLAHDIRGCKGGGCSDPTGIMSRLKRYSNSHGKNMRHHGSGRGSKCRGAN